MPAFVYYEELFPETEETRRMIVMRHPTLLPDTYYFQEMYCIDPACDCRLARFEVFANSTQKRLAVVTYVFEDEGRTDVTTPNPFLEPLADQHHYGPALLGLVAEVIGKEEAYRVRLVRHYDEVKQYMVDHPDSPLHGDVLRARRNMERMMAKFIGNRSVRRGSHKRQRRKER